MASKRTVVGDPRAARRQAHARLVRVRRAVLSRRPGALSEAVSEAVAEVTGSAPKLSTTGGTSDGRFIAPHRRAGGGARRGELHDSQGERVRARRGSRRAASHVLRPAAQSPRMKRVPDVLAAVDLGSNSFHMVVARYTHGQLVIIDRLREMVRLASGVEENGDIDKDVATRALACLERFGQRLREMKANGVRVVGTSALRLARHKKAFLVTCARSAGPSHRDHLRRRGSAAHLLRRDAHHACAAGPAAGRGHRRRQHRADHRRRLRAERSRKPEDGLRGDERALLRAMAASPPSGCIARAWRRASSSSRCRRPSANAAGKRRGQLRHDSRDRRSRCAELDPAVTGITPRGPRASAAALHRRGRHARDLALKILDAERRAVFPGGLAILAEDLRGAWQSKTCASRTARCAKGCSTTWSAASRTRMRASAPCAPCSSAITWMRRRRSASRRPRSIFSSRRAKPGSWTIRWRSCCSRGRRACMRSGSMSSHSGYHRHGAYLLENADMLGFPREEQRLLAVLVGGHRRKLVLDRPRRAGAAVGYADVLSDRAVAAGGAAASGRRGHRAAFDRTQRHAQNA